MGKTYQVYELNRKNPQDQSRAQTKRNSLNYRLFKMTQDENRNESGDILRK